MSAWRKLLGIFVLFPILTFTVYSRSGWYGIQLAFFLAFLLSAGATFTIARKYSMFILLVRVRIRSVLFGLLGFFGASSLCIAGSSLENGALWVFLGFTLGLCATDKRALNVGWTALGGILALVAVCWSFVGLGERAFISAPLSLSLGAAAGALLVLLLNHSRKAGGVLVPSVICVATGSSCLASLPLAFFQAAPLELSLLGVVELVGFSLLLCSPIISSSIARRLDEARKDATTETVQIRAVRHLRRVA